MTDDKAIEAAAQSDAQFDGRGDLASLSKADRQRYLDRSRDALAAADKVRAEVTQDDCGDEIGKLRMALAKGGAGRVALVERLVEYEASSSFALHLSYTGQFWGGASEETKNEWRAKARVALALVRKGV